MQSPSAAIDLGTNTARLLIGYRDAGGNITPVLHLRRITRLGGGFSREWGISAEAMERSLHAIREFAGEINRHGVSRVRAVATSAVRDAMNGRVFCDMIKRESGIGLDVIDGKTEGVLTLRGVLSALNEKSADLLVFDVGGGSTEYTFARGEKVLYTESLPVGVVRLTEGKTSLEAIEEKIIRELYNVHHSLAAHGLLTNLGKCTLVGTAGTATTLAAISMKMTVYDYRLVNNYELELEEIREIFSRLLPMTPEERLCVTGLEKGREDLIIAGTLVILNTMDLFGFRKLKVSDFGLLEGALLSIYKS
jgi:exopolyphosphatase / guanosine-5'-triphosphate,3'-diphosphate pyrophosphatase